MSVGTKQSARLWSSDPFVNAGASASPERVANQRSRGLSKRQRRGAEDGAVPLTGVRALPGLALPGRWPPALPLTLAEATLARGPKETLS